MQLTNRVIREAYEALAELALRDDLPIALSYSVALNRVALRPAAEVVEEERLRLVRRYARTDGDGTPTVRGNTIELADPDSYMREWQHLLALEQPIGTLQPIDYALLQSGFDGKERTISAAALDALITAGIVRLADPAVAS